MRSEFGMSDDQIEACGELSDEDLSQAYTMMQTCRDFENECNQVRLMREEEGVVLTNDGTTRTRSV